MKKCLITILLALPCLSVAAKVRFAYDVDFQMNFDNREYYRSNFSKSMTVFGARLSPYVGFEALQKDGTRHKVMLGVDVMKNFGGDRRLAEEISMYYRLDKTVGRTDISLCAGVFPRRFMDDAYSTAFFSDSLRFYDNNLEGMLVHFKRPRARFEIGCDWMGMFDKTTRERFMIFFSGEGKVVPWLSLGYSGYMYHLANSGEVRGVVDNFLLNPFVKADFAHFAPLQALSLKLEWLQSLQRDRMNVGEFVYPCGMGISTDIRKWNVGLKNDFFYGTDLMPYYNSRDAGGNKYGTLLYMGDPFYRVFDDSSRGWGTYDRLEAYYEPKVGNYLTIRLSAIFHFNRGYSGCQQIISLRFNLEELLRRPRKIKNTQTTQL